MHLRRRARARGLARAAAATLLLAAGPARADEELAFVVGAGAAAPVAPPEFPDFWKTGWSAGAAMQLTLSRDWETAIGVTYSRFPADEAGQIDDLLLSGPGGTSEIASIDGRAASALSLTADVRLHLRTTAARVSPYLVFGAGFFSLAVADAVIRATDPAFPEVPLPEETDSAFAATAGAGCRWKVGERSSVGLESVYLIGFTSRTSTQIMPFRVTFGRSL